MDSKYNYRINHNCNKILESDWLSAERIERHEVQLPINQNYNKFWEKSNRRV